MSIAQNIATIKAQLNGRAKLVAVSKTKPVAAILEAYAAGQHIFGENKVQELVDKQAQLPQDIEWHLIGHLQTNKVKYIASFVSLIQSVDSTRLLQEINKQGARNNRVINCLLQVYIAQEETKFGFDMEEVIALLTSSEFAEMKNVKIKGLMGMASNTDDEQQIRNEFSSLAGFYKQLRLDHPVLAFDSLSMGMSGDYLIAVSEGSNLVRVGSALFGGRSYQ